MKIEQELKLIIKDALKDVVKNYEVAVESVPEPVIERPKVEKHGDYSTNIAMVFSKTMNMKPRDLAVALKKTLESGETIIERVEIAGPGFINFFLCRSRYVDVLNEIFEKGEAYGQIDLGKGEKLQIEFVSANPTGPLHVGHGRGAIYGDALANVLKKANFNVSKEYYLNDAGVQIATLGKSVYLRIQELEGNTVEFPQECYQGH